MSSGRESNVVSGYSGHSRQSNKASSNQAPVSKDNNGPGNEDTNVPTTSGDPAEQQPQSSAGHRLRDPPSVSTPMLVNEPVTINDFLDTVIRILSETTEDAVSRTLPLTVTPQLLQPELLREGIIKVEDKETKDICGTVDHGVLERSVSGQTSDGFTSNSGRYSAKEKGKWKEAHEEDIRSDAPLRDENVLPLPTFADSPEEWVIQNEPILREYASRQSYPPLGRRVDVSLNEPSQFIEGTLQMLANRDPPHSAPEPSRQLEPQLLENFTDIHRWAAEYFRARFGQQTVGTNVPVILTIITNNFYEAHMHLIDRLVEEAMQRMIARNSDTLDLQDFSFGFDFNMSQDLPFFMQANICVQESMERYRPRSPPDLPPPQTTTTRYGRKSKMTKQAQVVALEEHEKQQKERQKQRAAAAAANTQAPLTSTSLPLHANPARSVNDRDASISVQSVKCVSSSSAPSFAPSASSGPRNAVRAKTVVYHTPNYGRVAGGKDLNMTASDVSTGMKCPTCGRTCPPRAPDQTTSLSPQRPSARGSNVGPPFVSASGYINTSSRRLNPAVKSTSTTVANRSSVLKSGQGSNCESTINASTASTSKAEESSRDRANTDSPIETSLILHSAEIPPLIPCIDSNTQSAPNTEQVRLPRLTITIPPLHKHVLPSSKPKSGVCTPGPAEPTQLTTSDEIELFGFVDGTNTSLLTTSTMAGSAPISAGPFRGGIKNSLRGVKAARRGIGRGCGADQTRSSTRGDRDSQGTSTSTKCSSATVETTIPASPGKPPLETGKRSEVQARRGHEASGSGEETVEKPVIAISKKRKLEDEDEKAE